MPREWTADLVGRMHVAGVTGRLLADEAGYTPEYVSMILNGHKEPKCAEQNLNAALDRLIEKKTQSTA